MQFQVNPNDLKCLQLFFIKISFFTASLIVGVYKALKSFSFSNVYAFYHLHLFPSAASKYK